MSTKVDEIKRALDALADAASALGCHGYGGYTTETAALDVVFIRCLTKLRTALANTDQNLFYDPEGMVYDALPSSDYF